MCGTKKIFTYLLLGLLIYSYASYLSIDCTKYRSANHVSLDAARCRPSCACCVNGRRLELILSHASLSSSAQVRSINWASITKGSVQLAVQLTWPFLRLWPRSLFFVPITWPSSEIREESIPERVFGYRSLSFLGRYLYIVGKYETSRV